MKSAEVMTGDKILSEKEKYIEKRAAEIDKWHDEIEDLDTKIMVADADAKAKLEHKEHLMSLRLKRDEARTRLAEIEAADDDRWEGLRDGLEDFWSSIKYNFEKAKAKF